MSVEEAKQALRQAARRAGPVYWVKHHPLETLGLSLLAGLAVGHSPRTVKRTAKRMLRVLAALFP